MLFISLVISFIVGFMFGKHLACSVDEAFMESIERIRNEYQKK